ncbi:hypothetical protein GSY71_06420 [Pusillimonas sp. TS35]|nr:hypothetical protein [Pusillimonas sp. TS35]
MKSDPSSNPRLQAVRIDPAGQARSYVDSQQRVTVVPLTIHRRQQRKVLTPPAETESALAYGGLDIAMVKTLGKAFYWQKLLDRGQYRTVTELARALRLEPGWVAEVLRMTLLAPEIVEAILEGRQPRHLNLHALRGRNIDWPRDWTEQQRALYATTDA